MISQSLTMLSPSIGNPQARAKAPKIVYISTAIEMPDDLGPPVITDFGGAKIGSGPFVGEVMPDLYRAPEIILGIPWDEKIDIWALGLMVASPPHRMTARIPAS